MKNLGPQRGSAMVEGAIIFPCLVLIVWWSAAITDVLVLKLKASEAARFALWETTAFRTPAEIDADVQARFVDLRSPASIKNNYTGLLMYPLASDIQWSARVNTSRSTKLVPANQPNLPTGGVLVQALQAIMRFITPALQAQMARWHFNTAGTASASVVLVRAQHTGSKILGGGDLLGLRGGNDLDHPPSMANLTFRSPMPSEHELQLVFDTWKAWPRPAQYTRDGGPTNTNVSPMQTYPMVEKKVSKQVDSIAFFGVNQNPFFSKVRGLLRVVTGAGITSAIAGGKLPDIFSTDLMDSSEKGPITILPPEMPDVGFAPSRCSAGACFTQRIGDFTSTRGMRTLPNEESMSNGVDRTRYTIPYKINTEYWRYSGGVSDKPAMNSALNRPPPQLTQTNQYVKTYACRGHYFAASNSPQQLNASRRYRASCR